MGGIGDTRGIVELNEYRQQLSEAIEARRKFLEKTHLPQLKDDCRDFHTSISIVYSAFVKKGFISEDPYKNDEKVDKFKIPDASAFSESNKRDQLGVRLSNLDNQFDFLVDFYPFSTENLNQETVKTILALVKYIDWPHLWPESKSPTTAAIAEIITQMRRKPSDGASAKVMNDALFTLERETTKILGALKTISDFNRELYKDELRRLAVNELPAEEANIANIKKKFTTAAKGTPFFAELAQEVINEDFGKSADTLRDKVLKSLAAPQEKPKAAKPKTSLKPILIEGLNAIGAAGATFAEITQKITENHELLQNSQKGLWAKIKKILAQMANKEDETIEYDIEYIDPQKGVMVKEKVDYTSFCDNIGKRTKILQAMSARGTALSKLEAMEDSQLIELLERNIKETLNFHKTLGGLDDFFKTEVDKADRSRVKGIKPELGTLKNAVTRANQKLHDYHATKEEEAQFKKLGINAEK
jgi:hypothetical protein